MTPPQLRLDEFIPYRLSFTSNIVSGMIASAYETLFGLKIPEWRMLAVIAETGGVTQQTIGARTRMDKVTVSRAAIALAARGLLVRTENPKDKRSHLLVLTKQGRKLYENVAPKALELERKIFAGFDKDELETFIGVLRRIDAVVLSLNTSEVS